MNRLNTAEELRTCIELFWNESPGLDRKDVIIWRSYAPFTKFNLPAYRTDLNWLDGTSSDYTKVSPDTEKYNYGGQILNGEFTNITVEGSLDYPEPYPEGVDLTHFRIVSISMNVDNYFMISNRDMTEFSQLIHVPKLSTLSETTDTSSAEYTLTAEPATVLDQETEYLLVLPPGDEYKFKDPSSSGRYAVPRDESDSYAEYNLFSNYNVGDFKDLAFAVKIASPFIDEIVVSNDEVRVEVIDLRNNDLFFKKNAVPSSSDIDRLSVREDRLQSKLCYHSFELANTSSDECYDYDYYNGNLDLTSRIKSRLDNSGAIINARTRTGTEWYNDILAEFNYRLSRDDFPVDTEEKAKQAAEVLTRRKGQIISLAAAAALPVQEVRFELLHANPGCRFISLDKFFVPTGQVWSSTARSFVFDKDSKTIKTVNVVSPPVNEVAEITLVPGFITSSTTFYDQNGGGALNVVDDLYDNLTWVGNFNESISNPDTSKTGTTWNWSIDGRTDSAPWGAADGDGTNDSVVSMKISRNFDLTHNHAIKIKNAIQFKTDDAGREVELSLDGLGFMNSGIGLNGYGQFDTRRKEYLDINGDYTWFSAQATPSSPQSVFSLVTAKNATSPGNFDIYLVPNRVIKPSENIDLILFHSTRLSVASPLNSQFSITADQIDFEVLRHNFDPINGVVTSPGNTSESLVISKDLSTANPLEFNTNVLDIGIRKTSETSADLDLTKSYLAEINSIEQSYGSVGIPPLISNSRMLTENYGNAIVGKNIIETGDSLTVELHANSTIEVGDIINIEYYIETNGSTSGASKGVNFGGDFLTSATLQTSVNVNFQYTTTFTVTTQILAGETKFLTLSPFDNTVSTGGSVLVITNLSSPNIGWYQSIIEEPYTFLKYNPIIGAYGFGHGVRKAEISEFYDGRIEHPPFAWPSPTIPVASTTSTVNNISTIGVYRTAGSVMNNSALSQTGEFKVRIKPSAPGDRFGISFYLDFLESINTSGNPDYNGNPYDFNSMSQFFAIDHIDITSGLASVVDTYGDDGGAKAIVESTDGSDFELTIFVNLSLAVPYDKSALINFGCLTATVTPVNNSIYNEDQGIILAHKLFEFVPVDEPPSLE